MLLHAQPNNRPVQLNHLTSISRAAIAACQFALDRHVHVPPPPNSPFRMIYVITVRRADSLFVSGNQHFRCLCAAQLAQHGTRHTPRGCRRVVVASGEAMATSCALYGRRNWYFKVFTPCTFSCLSARVTRWRSRALSALLQRFMASKRCAVGRDAGL